MTPVGPIERLRGKLRVIVVRDRARGVFAFRYAMKRAPKLSRAARSALPIRYGDSAGSRSARRRRRDVRIVDPSADLPSRRRGAISVCPRAEARFACASKGARFAWSFVQDDSARAARAAARAIEKAGFCAKLSENARIEPGADRTADVLVRRRDGQLAVLEPPAGGASAPMPR